MVWTGTSNCHRFQISSLSPRGHVAKKEQTMQGRVYRLWSMKWSKKLFTCCFSAKYDQNAKNGARTSKGQIPTKNKKNRFTCCSLSCSLSNWFQDTWQHPLHLWKAPVKKVTIYPHPHPPGPMTFESELSSGASALIPPSSSSELPVNDHNQLIFLVFWCIFLL